MCSARVNFGKIKTSFYVKIAANKLKQITQPNIIGIESYIDFKYQ